MFKFGFNLEHQNGNSDSFQSDDQQWFQAEQILPDYYIYRSICDKSNFIFFQNTNLNLKAFNVNTVLNHLKEIGSHFKVLQAESQHSDLITAQYEGGLKIWECTSDLLSYLDKQQIDFVNKKVLDLGCGSGMLGIYCLLNGSYVDFQDYNKEVIEYTTVPNVLLNDTENTKIKNSKFYSGDWKHFVKLKQPEEKYDIILTSETIYNPINYSKLIDIFKNLLKPSGVIYLAAKTYYFGVGGGTRMFENYLKQNSNLSSIVCWNCLEGVQREILKIYTS